MCTPDSTQLPIGGSQTAFAFPADAKQLAANGAELVEADASDEGQLRAAFEGAYGVFAMTVRLGGGGLDGAYEREFNSGAVCGRRLSSAVHLSGAPSIASGNGLGLYDA